MTKSFCDICGEQARDTWVEYTMKLEDRAWSGCKSTSGSISPTDGRYVPTFKVRPVFNVENLSQDKSPEHFPDLCHDCMVRLLVGLASKIKTP
jgi:hypothetical protein